MLLGRAVSRASGKAREGLGVPEEQGARARQGMALVGHNTLGKGQPRGRGFLRGGLHGGAGSTSLSEDSGGQLEAPFLVPKAQILPTEPGWSGQPPASG